jgi:thiosulfate dehydrogenase
MNQALIRHDINRALVWVLCLFLAALLVGCGQETRSRQPAAGDTVESAEKQSQAGPGGSQPEAASTSAPLKPIPAEKAVELTSCDGEDTVTVSEDLAGEALADALMDQWKRDHPGRDWVAEEKQAHAFNPPADNSDLLQGDQGKGHAYGNYTERDILIWARETEKFVAEGSRIFHSADELGSTVGVSCDMCHPHAANTHPETYPKFQTQLGRVVLLRDMIDWCVENPVRGEHIDPNRPKMRALEAYIMAQRKGVEMNYGKH